MDQATLPLGYPVAENEEERLTEILSYCLSEGDLGSSLDEVCLLAHSLFEMPMVVVSLVSRDRQNFIAKYGIADEGTAREDSFCTYTILADHVNVVGDATQDERFVHNKLVTGDLHLRFYAGAPLIVRPGVRIGSLSLLDTKPRDFTEADTEKLAMMATIVVNELRRRRALIDVRRQQNLLTQAARITKIGSWSYDVECDRLSFSDEAYEIFELERPCALSWELLHDFWSDDWTNDIEAEIRGVINVGIPLDKTVQITTAEGSRRWIRCLAEAEVVAGDVAHVIGSFQDITAERTHAAALEWIAFRDALTSLPNRAYFQSQLAAALVESERQNAKLGLLLFDLDHFKEINAAFGEEVGDALLRTLAGRLPGILRSSRMIFRLDGDEFAVILPELAANSDMNGPAQRLIDFLNQRKLQEGRRYPLTVSMGSAVYPDDGRDANQILHSAEIALREAKAGGRNRHVPYTHRMGEAIEARRALLAEIKAGLASREFVLFYQPIINVGEPLEVVGFEALMRWQHPTHGLLTPDRFHVAFDDQELSLPIGEVALDSALQQMRQWLDAGIEFGCVSVNISAAQFRGGDLVDVVVGKLKKWNVPANRLILEVTENVYMNWRADIVGDSIRALHDAGVLIALDDFGTGYASLQHLKQFPVDRLKIDKSFISDMRDPAIVSAILMIGAGMRIKVTAEGVEEEYQLDLLRAMGCHQVQGFLFAKPMPADAVETYLDSFDARRYGRQTKHAANGNVRHIGPLAYDI